MNLRPIAAATVLSAAFALAGCQSIANMTGTTNSAGADALSAAQTGVKVYADVYQPAVLAYGGLAPCGSPTATIICKDDALFQTLKRSDATLTKMIVDAKPVLDGSATDTGTTISVLMQAVSDAEVNIAASGALKGK